jgi:hypothetical protein
MSSRKNSCESSCTPSWNQGATWSIKPSTKVEGATGVSRLVMSWTAAMCFSTSHKVQYWISPLALLEESLPPPPPPPVSGLLPPPDVPPMAELFALLMLLPLLLLFLLDFRVPCFLVTAAAITTLSDNGGSCSGEADGDNFLRCCGCCFCCCCRFTSFSAAIGQPHRCDSQSMANKSSGA